MAETVTRSEDVVTRWSGKHVDADRIEEELALLRYEAAGKPEQGQGYALRTSFINLVIYANDIETAKAAGRTVASLAAHHPSRAIIVVARPDAEEHGIDTELSAHCHVAPGLERQVCCEEVALTVNGPAATHLHSVLAPLFIPDLPVYVWWIGVFPHDHHLFSDLMGMADGFIVDSARFTGPADDLRRLHHLSSRAPRCSLGDLNWQRLRTWREIIVQHASAPSLDEPMHRLTSVTVSFASRDGDERFSQALLMSAWLATSFGLQTDGASVQPGRFTAKADGREIDFAIAAREYPELAAGELISVEFLCEAGGQEAYLKIERSADPLHLHVTVREPAGTIDDHLRIEPGDEGLMLARELDSLAHDPEYHGVLASTLPLIAAIG